MNRRSLRPKLVGLMLAGLFASAGAQACTMCDSPTAGIVRDRISSPKFLTDLAALGAAFPFLFGAIALARREAKTRSPSQYGPSQ